MREFKDGITLQIYGGDNIFTRRKSDIQPYVVKVVSCEKVDVCPLVKEGQCFGVTGFGDSCKFAKLDIMKGTGYRSKSHYDLTKYRKHELYSKLKRPDNLSFVVIDNEVFMNIRYGDFKIDENGKLLMFNPYSRQELSKGAKSSGWFDKSVINEDFLTTLCEHVPRALMGGIIKDYQSEVLPNIIFHMSKYFPDLVREFISSDEKYAKLDSPIGKIAKLSTVADGEEVVYNDHKFTKYRSSLECDDYVVDDMPFGAKKLRVKIDIDKDMTVAITDINQVNAKTEFV